MRKKGRKERRKHRKVGGGNSRGRGYSRSTKKDRREKMEGEQQSND